MHSVNFKGGIRMELAKVTSKGQITIPAAIRKLLGIKDGDKVLFVQEGGKVVIMNASVDALMEVQRAFQGVAEELGIENEQDVVEMVRQIRAEGVIITNANNAGYQCADFHDSIPWKAVHSDVGIYHSAPYIGIILFCRG